MERRQRTRPSDAFAELPGCVVRDGEFRYSPCVGRVPACCRSYSMAQYFFQVSNGPDLGPMSAEEFQQRLAAGEIKDATMVWRSGMGDWSTYRALCAAEKAVAPASPPASATPASPRKAKASPAAAAPKPKFLACGACGQEWPDTLLFAGICGSCKNRQKAEADKGRKMPGAGTSLTGWIFIAVSIVCAVGLVYRIIHPLPPPPKGKVKELTEPAKYGR